MPHFLIVDDDEQLCHLISQAFSDSGHHVDQAPDIMKATEQNSMKDYDVILLDVNLPDGSGLENITKFRDSNSIPEIIVITGDWNVNGARQAIRKGAWTYIQKPIRMAELKSHVDQVLLFRKEKLQKRHKNTPLMKSGIIGSSPEIKNCLELVHIAAQSNISTLITGDTGTGKELFARAIHENSSRAAKNFVVVDCAAIPKTLAETIILGHRRGAFTGAEKSSIGLVKQADGGTLFLDEIGELPLELQKTFLRVLQEHRYRPVGSLEEVESNFRLVAATNRNLDHMAAQDTFRQDLLFRLKGFEIHLPPLSGRRIDILELAGRKMDSLCRKYGEERKIFSADFIEALKTYHWPGNVRELYQTIKRVFSTTIDSKNLFEYHLPENIRIHYAERRLQNEPVLTDQYESNPRSGDSAMIEHLPWKTFKENQEAEYFRLLLVITRGNITAAGKISGISRSRLYQIFEKHDLLSRKVV